MRRGQGLWKCIDKKRHYWPRGVYGDVIDDYFGSKHTVDMGCLSGEWDETDFNVFVLKYPDYNIMMMLKNSGLTIP